MQPKLINKELSYYQNGDNPKLLIHAGTHGDEYEVIDIVTETIDKYLDILPPFIYVPKVSPSAVNAKTRLNKNGNDLNRVFYSDITDEEVQENIEVMQKGLFDLFVSFHEDPELDSYYIYDTNFDDQPTKLIIDHNTWLKSQGIPLLNGLDDPTDSELGYEFIDGYKKFKHEETTDNGMILVWGLNHKVIQHSILPEIPGKMELGKKRTLVDSIFQKVIIPYFKE
jgi:hypothetical protein